MKLYAKNAYLICEPYELTHQNSNSLLIQNVDSDNVAKILNKDDDNCYCYGVKCEINDIILYNKDKAKEYMLNNKRYIIVELYDVIAVIKEDE